MQQWNLTIISKNFNNKFSKAENGLLVQDSRTLLPNQLPVRESAGTQPGLLPAQYTPGMSYSRGRRSGCPHTLFLYQENQRYWLGRALRPPKRLFWDRHRAHHRSTWATLCTSQGKRKKSQPVHTSKDPRSQMALSASDSKSPIAC